MSTIPSGEDFIQPFQVESGPVRGRLVRLGPVVDTILSRHDYPEPVAVMLGELLALAAAVAGAFKFDGLFTMQIQSDGPISMMVADLAMPGEMRGCAKFDKEALEGALAEGVCSSDSVPRLLGAGHLVFTIDLGPDTELCQGYVSLEGATLAECAHNYFRQSDQLDAALRLAAGRIDDGTGAARWRSGAVMVQRLAAAGEAAADFETEEESEDAWRQALALMGSLRDEELTDPTLGADDVLYRLFHASGVRVFKRVALDVGCRCERGRILRILNSFGADEVAEMVVDGRVVVTCEFCNSDFVFAESDFSPLARS